MIKGINDSFENISEFVKMFEKDPPTAVFFANDLMAIGAYEAADKYNIKIPDDISIIGHDGIIYSELVNPRLTTMVQPKKKLGEIAAGLLINIISGKVNDPEDVILSAKLIKRQSTSELI